MEIKALCGLDHVENSHTPAAAYPQTTAELVRKIVLALLGKLRCSLLSRFRSVWLFSTGIYLKLEPGINSLAYAIKSADSWSV